MSITSYSTAQNDSTKSTCLLKCKERIAGFLELPVEEKICSFLEENIETVDLAADYVLACHNIKERIDPPPCHTHEPLYI